MFTDEELFTELNRLLDLQIGDIKKAYDAGADVLCLVGCMNLIEFMGGIRTGKIGSSGNAERRFRKGVELLSERHNGKYLGASTLWNLRCGLVHQFIPEDRDNNIGIFLLWGKKFRMFDDEHALRPPHFKTGGKIPFETSIITQFLIEDLEKAREMLVDEIRQNDGLRNKLCMTLWWMPRVKEQDENNPLELK